MMDVELHAAFLQSTHPTAQQRRGLAIQREHAAGAADIGLDAETACPLAQGVAIEIVQPRADLARTLAIARIEPGPRFGMGEIEPALAGNQELAPDRALGFEQMDLDPGRAGDLGGHQAGRAATDHGKAGRVGS